MAHAFWLFHTLSLALPGAALAASAPRTEVELTLRNCNKFEVSAIFGANVQGCLIYDVRKREAVTTLEICGGLMIKLALKEVVLGGELGHEKIGCVTVKTVLNPSDTSEALRLLTSSKPESESLRRLVLGRVRSALKQRSDAELREMGLTRDQIDKLETLRFETPNDATGRSEAIKKSIERCPVVGTKQLSRAARGRPRGVADRNRALGGPSVLPHLAPAELFTEPVDGRRRPGPIPWPSRHTSRPIG
jgi:hypothetical protein